MLKALLSLFTDHRPLIHDPACGRPGLRLSERPIQKITSSLGRDGRLQPRSPRGRAPGCAKLLQRKEALRAQRSRFQQHRVPFSVAPRRYFEHVNLPKQRCLRTTRASQSSPGHSAGSPSTSARWVQRPCFTHHHLAETGRSSTKGKLTWLCCFFRETGLMTSSFLYAAWYNHTHRSVCEMYRHLITPLFVLIYLKRSLHCEP